MILEPNSEIKPQLAGDWTGKTLRGSCLPSLFPIDAELAFFRTSQQSKMRKSLPL